MAIGANLHRAERQSYLYRHLATHLHAAGDIAGLFALVERPGFLARQAEVCGFQQTGEDLEVVALPAAIAAADWDRFFHYALLALNLRGLAEATVEEPVLRALARSGLYEIAEDAMARVSEPLRRAAARARLAADREPDSPRFAALVRGIEDDLEAAEKHTEVVDPRALDALCEIARRLGPTLGSRLKPWHNRMAPDLGFRVRLAWAVAEGYLARGAVEHPELWNALSSADPAMVFAELPERLGERDLSDPALVLEQLKALLGPGDRFWQAAVRLLGVLARRRAAPALATWEGSTATEEVPWSAELVEAGEELFRQLPAQQLSGLASASARVDARAALSVLALAADPTDQRVAAALEAVSAIPDGALRLHWSLRYLAARPPGPEAERQLGAVRAYLRELRYQADPVDCARFLDLAAQVFPRRALDLEVESVVYSPLRRPETLRSLAKSAQDDRVLDDLLDKVERYAAAVSDSEAEAFLLRVDVMSQIVRRLTLRRRDLVHFERAIERLLPEEEDSLRVELAGELDTAGELELARTVAAGIRDPRLRLATYLPTLPSDELGEALGRPGERYRTLASSATVHAELSALLALLEAPLDPANIAARYLSPLRDREIQASGLLRLGWHSVAFEEIVHAGREDRSAVIELVRASLRIADDDELARRTPEIAALGAQRGPSWAVVELREAVRRVLALTAVPWETRRDALEEILARMGPLLFDSAGKPRRRALRGAAEVGATAVRLPLDLESTEAREEIRRHWDEVLPLLIAVFDRLPDAVSRLLADIPALWPGWESEPEHGANEPWRQAIELCLASGREREAAAERCLAGQNDAPAILRTLAYLLARSNPARVPELVRRLAAGPERDALCLRLIRYPWLSVAHAASLIGFVANPDVKLRAELAAAIRGEGGIGDRWIAAVERLATRATLDPADPSCEPLVRLLWSAPRERSRPALARAVVGALRSGGKPLGEAALRLWLHAHLSPQLGRSEPARSELGKRVEAAFLRARSLGVEAA